MQKDKIVFGTRVVIEAIRSGQSIEKIWVQSHVRSPLMKELIAMAQKEKLPLSFVPRQKLDKLQPSKNHQGVVGLLAEIEYVSLQNVIDKSYQESRELLFIVLDRITDVRNFGAIVRTAECAGVVGIIIASSGNAIIAPDAIKASAGAIHHIPICRQHNLDHALTCLKENGIKIIACTEKAKKNIYQVDLTSPIALIMGSEHDGISEKLLTEADEKVSIPLVGNIDALNVSVSAGIALYEAMRQKHYK